MISKKKRRKILRRLQNARLIASGSTLALFGILFTAAYTGLSKAEKMAINGAITGVLLEISLL